MVSDTGPIDKRTGILKEMEPQARRGGPTEPLSKLDLEAILNAGNPGFAELTEVEVTGALNATLPPESPSIFEGLTGEELDRNLSAAIGEGKKTETKPRLPIVLAKTIRDSLVAQEMAIFLMVNYPQLSGEPDIFKTIITEISQALSNERLEKRMEQNPRENAQKIANGIVEGYLTKLEKPDGQSVFTPEEKVRLEEAKPEISTILLKSYDSILSMKRGSGRVG